MDELSSVYEPESVERRWYERWREAGYFRPGEEGEPFTVVLPPPNVTGRLHMGHALTATIEDCLVRWKRMSGHAALWLPGTDHAGIATQVMVERALQAEGTSRLEVGREKFLVRVWQWKEEHGGIIDRQHERIGASLDWSRYRFTMDPESSRAVREAFCRLYEDGLIYRAYRLINWDWASQTALSDLEVDSREVQGSLWHIAYPVEGSDETLVVATTRPETMLGDTGVAVHPEDPRYKHLVGRKVRLPLTGRLIPIVGDSILVDMEFGTGAVKVTPAHDFNDFETGQRHGLEVLCILGLDGRINEHAPQRFRGLDVAAARKAVLAELETVGALIKSDAHSMIVGFSSRNPDVAVEPLPSTQWFVKVGPLAAPALQAVRDGRTQIFPSHRTADYFRWMENIHDWCISRQLWWGHRIPAWHCEGCKEITVSRQDPDACAHCGSSRIVQDEDVLDTWFSSGLWPLTTLGWPDRDDDIKRFYPTTLMETGHDILFFWVARMMMFGLHFGGDVPFRTVFLHSMVLGEDGQKMSKTKGNVVDPVELISEFGADALRFYLCTMAGQDAGIIFARARVEGYRHFANKLWNAARFARMNLEGFEPDEYRTDIVDELQFDRLSIADRWILARACEVAVEFNDLLDKFRLDLAAHCAYQFVWYELCDWYLELAKLRLRAQGSPDRALTQGTLVTVFDLVLRMLHPMIPFITEELWSHFPHAATDREESLMVAEFPRVIGRNEVGAPTMMAGPIVNVGELWSDESVVEARQAVDVLIRVVTTLRGLRAQFRIPPSQKVLAQVRVEDEGQGALLRQVEQEISHLARLERLEILPAKAELGRETAVEVVAGLEVALPLAGLVDLAQEQERIQTEVRKQQAEIEKLDRKLKNPQFRSKAPADVVAKDEARKSELEDNVEKLRSTLERLRR